MKIRNINVLTSIVILLTLNAMGVRVTIFHFHSFILSLMSNNKSVEDGDFYALREGKFLD